MAEYIFTSSEEMFAFGQELAQSHTIIFLEGELGAGKTTLVKGFAAGLGLDPMKVNSPTYTYIQEYSNDSQASLKNHGNGKLLHIDMYNINEPQQLIEKGIAELVHEYDYVAIEWPKFLDVLGLDGVRITIQKLEGDERRVNVTH